MWKNQELMDRFMMGHRMNKDEVNDIFHELVDWSEGFRGVDIPLLDRYLGSLVDSPYFEDEWKGFFLFEIIEFSVKFGLKSEYLSKVRVNGELWDEVVKRGYQDMVLKGD